MQTTPSSLPEGECPLASSSPLIWDRLIEAVGPASLLIVIGQRMGAELRRRSSPEDVWQETLLHAWRDRGRCQWQGVPAFRRWLLQVAENRIRDLADHERAARRGAGVRTIAFSSLEPSRGAGSTGGSVFAGPIETTSPSRLASLREEAGRMERALEGLPEELREVVRLRLFEETPIEEIARVLGIGVSAVRHRFRKGCEIYHRRLAPGGPAPETDAGSADSAPVDRP